MRSCEYTIKPRITTPIRENSSYGVTLKLIEATLGIEGENYPFIQMIISSFSAKNSKWVSQTFSWDIKLVRQP
jgi:hypothetical protein